MGVRTKWEDLEKANVKGFPKVGAMICKESWIAVWGKGYIFKLETL